MRRSARWSTASERSRTSAPSCKLLATYGPAVDSGSHLVASELWSADGVYDVDVGVWQGREAISRMLCGDAHTAYLSRGCAHQVSISRITIDGDRAIATSYMSLIETDGDTYRIRRQTAQRWELQREDDGWRIERRIGRLLDGTQEPLDLLHLGLDGAGSSSG